MAEEAAGQDPGTQAAGASGGAGVVDAAMACFAARGWHATSRRDIAEAAEIGRAHV